MKIPEIYLSSDFVDKLAQSTFCGSHAWHRLLSWLSVDQPFQDFMEIWQNKFMHPFHNNDTLENLPPVDGALEPFFDDLYPAQFILRMAQIAEKKKLTWLFSALNNEQQETLHDWLIDSRIDAEKSVIADNWTAVLDEKSLSISNTNIYSGLTAEVMSVISQLANTKNKKKDSA